MKVMTIYDDTGRKSDVIRDIIGEKGFSDVVVKKRRLEEYYYEFIEKIYPDVEWKTIHSTSEYLEVIKWLESCVETNVHILHVFSNYIVSDEEKVLLSLEKLNFIDRPYRVMHCNRVAVAMFPDIITYIQFCRNVISDKKSWDAAKEISDYFEIEGLVDIGIVGNFIQCITGNFDSRYFNSLQGNEYTLVKSSSNKKKIKSEYTFYHLLPDDMKFWFVMPFNYIENKSCASYTMERLHMTDLAIKWVHGSIDENEFTELLDKYFFFFKSRHKKKCSVVEYQEMANTLYVDKVIKRTSDLKKLEAYDPIKKLLEVFDNCDLDSLINEYFCLKEKIEAKVSYDAECVIGHGDPCFANTLYNKSTKTLKFIDPKGALTEDELWTNPYYDVAKLSHSICGRYDFFNNGLFDIRLGSDFSYILDIPFDNSKYIKIFKEKVEENGFDYLTVRIYEASLFLSMLPLHIDNPHKVMVYK